MIWRISARSRCRSVTAKVITHTIAVRSVSREKEACQRAWFRMFTYRRVTITPGTLEIQAATVKKTACAKIDPAFQFMDKRMPASCACCASAASAPHQRRCRPPMRKMPPAAPIESTLPVDPMLSTLPDEPIERMLPALPIESRLPALARLNTLAALYRLKMLRKLPALRTLAREPVDARNPCSIRALSEIRAIASCSLPSMSPSSVPRYS